MKDKNESVYDIYTYLNNLRQMEIQHKVVIGAIMKYMIFMKVVLVM